MYRQVSFLESDQNIVLKILQIDPKKKKGDFCEEERKAQN